MSAMSLVGLIVAVALTVFLIAALLSRALLMSTTTAGFLFVLSLVAALAAVYRPLGDYLYLVADGSKHSSVERGVYRRSVADPARRPTGPQQ